MMPNVTLGGSPASVQQKGERGGKNAEIDDKRFDEALTGRAADRMAARGDAEERRMDTPQDWKIDRYAALFRLEKTVANRAPSDGPAFSDAVTGQDTAATHRPSLPVEPEIPASEEGTENTRMVPETEKSTTEEPEAAFALLQSLAAGEDTAKKPDGRNLNARDAEEKNAPGAVPAIDEANADTQRSAINAPVQRTAGEQHASAIRAFERTTAPPVDGQPPARTRADAKPQVTAAVADRPATASHPSSPQQQDDVASRPATATPIVTDSEVTRFVSAKDGSFTGDTPPNVSAAKPDAVASRVNVLNFTAAPAPAPMAPPVLSTTAASLVAAIEADGTAHATTQDPAILVAPRSGNSPAGVNTLRIQLQPAELGMVTARLVASGSQLSVEIQVESNDARQRLANDSEVIVKALRAIGYDVEKVTIQQAPQSGQSATQQGASGRNDQMPPDQQGDRSARGRGEQGMAGRDGEGARNGAGEAAADRSGGGRYI